MNAGSWEYVEPPLHPALRGVVVRSHGYRQLDPTPLAHRALPEPIIPMVLSFGPVHVMTTEQNTVKMASFTAGLTDRPVRVAASEYHGIQVDMTPLGATQVLGVPAGDLAGELCDVGNVLGAEGSRLIDQLATASSWRACFAVLNRFLFDRIEGAPDPPPAVAEAWRRMSATHGQVRIRHLADELGSSPRHLSSQFRHHVGLSPKRAARVWRFHRVATLLAHPASPSLAAVALEGGYYDQAHLSNEVKAMSGFTPDALRSLHADDGPGVFEPI